LREFGEQAEDQQCNHQREEPISTDDDPQDGNGARGFFGWEWGRRRPGDTGRGRLGPGRRR
jgi:hypothetical protein